jgi:hypothetical protein
MQNMRDLLRSSLGRSLRDLPELDRLAAAWPVACGSALASRAEITALTPERVVHISVHHVEWLDQFQHMRSALQSDLARIAAVPLTGIHFELQRPAPTPNPGSPS